MAVFAAGLNTDCQILSGGPPLLCCPTPVTAIENTHHVHVALSHILWETDAGWQITGYRKDNKVEADIGQRWKISASEMRIAAINHNGSVLLREKDCWRELYFQKDFEVIEKLPSDSRTLDTTEKKVESGDEESHSGRDRPEDASRKISEKKFSAVCVEDNSLIALDEDGKAYSSGVPLPYGGCKIVDVQIGKEHCVALTVDGVVLTWGSGMRGQLGNGELGQAEYPETVESLQGIAISSIACGGWHSAALSTAGDVYVWGWNESGQLGFPTKSVEDSCVLGKFRYSCQCQRKTEQDSSDKKTTEYCMTDARVNTTRAKDIVNVQVSPKLMDFWNEDMAIKSVKCGDRHTLYQLEDGSIWSTGMNKYGQLGLGDTNDRDEPCLVPVEDVSKIYAGGWISVFVTNKRK